METTEHHLRSMIREVDEEHHSSMASFSEAQRELLHGDATAAGRRSFLKRVSIGGGAIAIGSVLTPWKSLLAPAMAQDIPLADLAKFAASVERAAVALYEGAAASGKVTTPAVGEAATAFASHHADHAAAFEALIGEMVAPNQALLDALVPQLEAAADEPAVLELAYGVENSASSTYLFALGIIDDVAAAEAVASIMPVEARHAVVLGSVLGKAPDAPGYLPSFEPLEGALDPAMFPVA